MTADPSAGAVSHLSTDWHAIPWKTVNETVRRLQARIVQATKAGKWHKVQALQHLLTHSFSGKALAVRRVTENQGKNTPGVDKQLLRSLRRNVSPVELIDGPFLMSHEDLAYAPVELLEVAKAASCANRVLHHPPEAFDGIEMVATMGR